MATKTISKCPVCGYPVQAEYEGQATVCAYCGEKLEAVITQGITISTPVFVGILAFAAGMLLGPALIATTSGGREWLEKQAREAIRR